MFSLFELSAMLLTLSALFGWIDHKYLPLPHAVGLLAISVATSGVMVAVDMAFPARHLFESSTGTFRQIDFTTLVTDGMLAFLLFAGALHVDLGELKSRAIPVALLAFAGTVISTGVKSRRRETHSAITVRRSSSQSFRPASSLSMSMAASRSSGGVRVER